MQTILDILNKTSGYFAGKGVPKPKLDAEHLMAHVLECTRMDLYLQYGRPMTDAQLDALRPLVRRRSQREPLQYILGTAPFVDAELACRPGALIPRPETEELVERILERWKQFPAGDPKQIIDLGTGSGALAIALAQAFPDAQVTATDVSTEALALARENARSNGVDRQITFAEAAWWEGVSGTFDLIVSNPPYLTAAEVAEAEPEVKDFEPVGALQGRDADGAGDLREIIRGARPHLPGSGPYLVGLETGIEQHAELTSFAADHGFAQTAGEADLSRRPRFFWLWSEG